jgi:hypothetical protein
MKTAYLISTGSYSDYHVEYVCATKDVAEEILERLNRYEGRDEFRMEERRLLESSDELEAGIIYSVLVDKDGREVRRFSYAWHGESEPQESTYRVKNWHEYEVSATSPRGYDVALKAARDVLAEGKAEAEGL